MCLNVLFCFVSMYVVHLMCAVTAGEEEGIEFLYIVVTHDCKTPCGRWEQWISARSNSGFKG